MSMCAAEKAPMLTPWQRRIFEHSFAHRLAKGLEGQVVKRSALRRTPCTHRLNNHLALNKRRVAGELLLKRHVVAEIHTAIVASSDS